MEASTSGLAAKRQRKKLFDYDVGDLNDSDILFEESGSEYNPESEEKSDSDNDILAVSTTIYQTFRLCGLPSFTL